MKHARKSNLFTEVPVRAPKRSTFDLSHEVKMSGKFGYLYPVLCMDVLPGDTVRDEMSAMVRFAPMLAPVMHRCDVSTHFFFVPNRIITDHWENFITGGQDGLQAPVMPYVIAGDVSDVFMRKGSVWDYLGMPVAGAAEAVTSQEQVSALPFRALGKIWNDYYRDPNFDAELTLSVELQGNVTAAAGMGSLMDLSNYRRGFEKDYFTSALPWAQRGAQVALGSTITYLSQSLIKNTDGSPVVPPAGDDIGVGPGGGQIGSGVAFAEAARIENLASVSMTVNEFRRSMAIQRWLEANARGGGRYTEQIQSHFAVQVPDYRLQRAEYLGGGKQPVQISEVMNMAQSTGEPVGDLYGHGISVGRTNRFTYRCQEHGFVIGILSVTMRTAYAQGIPKMFSRVDKYDYAWPELANLGEQEIKSKEIFYSFQSGDDVANAAVFGYTPRYAEYKFRNDRVAGDFRDTLGFWHLGRKFLARPVLASALTTIYENGVTPGADEETFRRIFAVQDGTDYLWMQLYHRLTAKRPLPYFGVPSIS